MAVRLSHQRGPDRRRPFSGWTDESAKANLVALALLALHAALCLIGMRFNSPTVDEPAHIARGYHYLVTGKLSLDVSPPLMNAISALPLLLRKGIIVPPLGPTSWVSVTDFADKFVWVYNDAATIVGSARLPTILLSAVLGYFVFRWAWSLGGLAAGLLALFLYVLDPNILAHSQLATTDLGVACFIFIATYFLWRFLRWRQGSDLMFAGALLGFAQAIKLSALILVPVSIMTVLGEVLFTTRRARAARFCGVVLLVLFGLSFLCLWASYRFEMASLMSEYATGVDPFRALLQRVQVPLSAYVRGLRWLQRRAERTGPVFLMGRHASGGWWYYSLLTFLLKTPIPTQILLLIAASLALRRGCQHSRPYSARLIHNREYIIVLPILGFLLATTIFSSLRLDYRHILPILPFAFVLASRATRLMSSRWGRLALVALALWYVVGTVRIYPHCLAYFNEFVGGPHNGYQYLVGSNLDWGQDLKNLKAYLEQRQLASIYLAYYGSAHPDYYGIQARPLPTDESAVRAEPASSAGDNAEPVYCAISVTYLQGSYLEDPEAFSWLRKYAPVDKIGYSIFVYKLE